MKKTKRYQAGGPTEEDLKKEGLDESRNERVSLLERFRMGNIDNPNSEAYKRFGAGRGAAKRASVQTPGSDTGMGVPGIGAPVGPTQAPTEMDRTPRGVPGFGADMLPKVDRSASDMPSKMPAGLRSALTAQGEGEGGKPVAVKTEKTVVKTPRKSITKVEKVKTGSGASGFGMDESSFDNRRSASTPKEKTEISAPGGKFIEKNVRQFQGVKSASGNNFLTPPKYGANKVSDAEAAQLEKKRSVANAKKTTEAKAVTKANRAKSSSTVGKMPGFKQDINDPFSMTLGGDLDPKSMMRSNKRLSGEAEFRKGGAIKSSAKFSSGGMTGRASSRADGIAKRGKTKGRIC